MIEQINCQQLKRRIMARIYAIYVLRQTTSPLCLKTLALGTSLGLGLFWFSWEQIFENMTASVDGVYPFINTELQVQFIVVAATGITLWIVQGFFPATTMAVYNPLRFFRQKAV